MSQMSIKRSLTLIGLCLSMAVIVSCSSGNSDSLINPDTGKHSANWMIGNPPVHGTTAETGLFASGSGFAACQTCHGGDFKGGIAKVSCSTGTANGCHDGPGLNHPAPGWVVPLSSGSTLPFHKTEAGANVAFCAKCHGADYLGGAVGVACSKCHLDGPTSIHGMGDSAGNPGNIVTDHPDYVHANGVAKCENAVCHGPITSTVAAHWDPITNTNLSGPNCNNGGGAPGQGNFACHACASLATCGQ